MYCRQCGHKMADGECFCTQCGTPVSGVSRPADGRGGI
ncbi:MAG: zinc-ribbon domain-containing protein [Christensenellales bacterium]